MTKQSMTSNRRQVLKMLAAIGGGCLWNYENRVFGQQEDPVTRSARGERWAVATVHPHATRAAADVLRDGGNAIDAAIAASFMLSVVDGHNSGIGGGGFALLRTPNGDVRAIDAREMAPAAITPEHYFRDGKAEPRLSQVGPLAVGVPGLVAGLWEMSNKYGSMEWRRLVRPASEMAQAGFRLGDLAKVIRRVDEDISRFPETVRILKPQGKLPSAEHRLIQSDLARTLETIASEGAKGFYRGTVADRIATAIQQAGGVVTRADLANYVALERRPIESAYRNYQVFGFPPPSSGGVHIAQMLTMLEPYDLSEIFRRSQADYLHLLLEVMRRAMADRAQWLGDADFVDVPAGLLDVPYLRQRMESFDFQKVNDEVEHGLPPGVESQFLGDRHTTHLTTADRQGNVVAMTQTVNTSFGSKMIAGGTGVVLNNEMDDFSIAPGVRNAFGLLGTAANAIQAGKRPLSSMSPTIVLDERRRPIVTCGAAGGPRIITATLQNLLGVLDLGLSIPEALARPRVHHQWSPNRAYVEQGVPAEVREALKDRGHQVNVIQASATAQGIRMDGNILEAGSETRINSQAAAG